MPSGAAWRFGTGVQQQLNDKSSIGVAFEYLLSEDAYVPTPALLAGSYDSPQIFFLATYYGYRFKLTEVSCRERHKRGDHNWSGTVGCQLLRALRQQLRQHGQPLVIT